MLLLQPKGLSLHLHHLSWHPVACGEATQLTESVWG